MMLYSNEVFLAKNMPTLFTLYRVVIFLVKRMAQTVGYSCVWYVSQLEGQQINNNQFIATTMTVMLLFSNSIFFIGHILVTMISPK